MLLDKLILKSYIVTGRNEVVAKVMFLQVCVCPRGGGCFPQSMLGCHPPTPDGEPPRMESPPGWRTPPDGGPTLPPPPGWRTPPRKQTPAYGLRAASTHPTGMHSCYLFSVAVFFVSDRDKTLICIEASHKLDHPKT